jgi:GNAT superfamily N-acetyltransferase
LLSPTNDEEWSAYHRIRRTVLFERRGLSGRYDADHPDEHKTGNYPKLLATDTTFIGVIRIDIEAELARFRRIAIDVPWQRQGYGRILLALSEAFALERGALRVESAVAEDAVEFYRKCGYRLVRSSVESRGVRMAKELRPRDRGCANARGADAAAAEPGQ